MELVGLSPTIARPQSTPILDANAAQFSTARSSILSCRWRKNEASNSKNRYGKDAPKLLMPQGQNSVGLREDKLKRKRSIVTCSSSSPPQSSSASPQEEDVASGEQAKEQILAADGETELKAPKEFKSSWTAKDAEGKDYLYRLGAEADNMNITVGARAGMIDDLFTGKFLGLEADIVFKYRQKVTRSFNHIQGDYYIAPLFLDKVVTHIAKNYLAPHLETKVPLILGVWGGKGQGKSFQIELICKALDLEPVIMSAGEMESEWAGQPGKLIRERYRTSSQVIKNQGKMSALIINDLDAGIGRFENTQCTVNNQMVVGTLMNLCDNPTRVSIGQEWREADVVNRVPIIVTGNDFSTLWAPLIRDGRMDKFYWQPTREDIINTVSRMYREDGITVEEIASIVDIFPNQALDFYGALRSRTYDLEVLKWANEIGTEHLARKLVSRKKDEPLPVFIAPEQTVEKLIEAGKSLVEEQKRVMEMRLSDDYMKKQTGPSIGLLAS
ncbi:hypothetical protein R1flu_010769 [Riccia fluitans]|uniref:Ribulose bisphosphate carboxylase/oxygenase activase, chloroplastic n=1 Tax=Riccia fluitans TaxID=41844 RepID=A0ABD1Z5Y6_9MARC